MLYNDVFQLQENAAKAFLFSPVKEEKTKGKERKITVETNPIIVVLLFLAVDSTAGFIYMGSFTTMNGLSGGKIYLN